MKKLIPATLIIGLALFASCSKNLPDAGASNTVKMANEWWVTFSLDGNDLLGTHVKLSTYNTSANDDSLWVDDLGHTWQFKVKAKTNLQSLTFSADSAQNETYDIQVFITDGQIFPKGGVSKTGRTTDSIYMKVRFTDDPTNTYIISGSGRTMYSEDDYQ
jgi:hypothetical protein